MAFLTPLFLLGLLAIAVPVAIHFIRRDKPPVVAFSSLRFFQPRSRKQFLFQRFQQWLLLLLRALVVILLALAFARPFFSETFSGMADLAPRSVVIAVDRSMSMGYGDRLSQAKNTAQQLLNELSPGDEATLMLFADEVEAVHGPTTDLASLTDVLDQLTVGYGGTAFFPALRLGDEHLQEARFQDRTLYLVSDFQAIGLESLESQWLLAPGTNFVGESVADSGTQNLSVTGVKAPAMRRAVSDEETIQVRVRSTGSVPLSRGELSLLVGGEQQSTQSLALADQSEVVVPLTVPLSANTSHAITLQLAGDDFALDNQYHLTVDVLPKLQVLLVNGAPANDWLDDEGHWLQLALTGHEQSPFAVTQITAAELSKDLLADHDVVVLLNVAEFSAAQAQSLTRFVEQGGSALLGLGDAVNATTYNQQLSSILPGQLIDPQFPRRGDYRLIAEVDQRHPLLRPLDVDWLARFHGHWWVEPNDQAEVLMALDNGHPLLLATNPGEGRVLLFTSGLDMSWNNLPLQGMYLPFVYEMLKHLDATPDKQSAYTVGDRVSLPEGQWQLQGAGEVTEGKVTDSLTLAAPGIYQLRQTDAEPLHYAANPPLAESRLATLSPGDLMDRIINPETSPSQSAAVRSALLKQELERPQRIWWWLLLAVALLLIAEAVLANRTYR